MAMSKKESHTSHWGFTNPELMLLGFHHSCCGTPRCGAYPKCQRCCWSNPWYLLFLSISELELEHQEYLLFNLLKNNKLLRCCCLNQPFPAGLQLTQGILPALPFRAHGLGKRLAALRARTQHIYIRGIYKMFMCVCAFTWHGIEKMLWLCIYICMYISLYIHIYIYIQRFGRKSNLWFFKIWMSPWSHRPPSLSPASVPALHLRLVAVEPSQLAERSQSAEFLLCVSAKKCT